MTDPSSRPGATQAGEQPNGPQSNTQNLQVTPESGNAIQPGASQPGVESAGQQLEYRARSLAEAHIGKVLPANEIDQAKSATFIHRQLKPAPAYLSQYQQLIEEANRRFRSASETEMGMSIAAEWMLDNSYIVLQALREVHKDLPPHFYAELPCLSGGILQGYPRVYALAHDLIQHEHAAIDPERVKRFIRAYQAAELRGDTPGSQAVNPLTMGELWALPSMLRLGVIENLALCVGRLTGQLKPDEIRHFPSVIQGKELSADQLVANCVLSLRAIGTQDWKEFFEETSLVEGVLKREPAGVYATMDFETRDLYRKAVEALARQGRAQLARADEREVARQAVRLASASNGSGDQRQTHVGFYLVDKGRKELEGVLGVRRSFQLLLQDWLRNHPAFAYLGSIGLVAAFLVVLAGIFAASLGKHWQALLAMVLALIPALTTAVDLVNWAFTHSVSPRRLPKMDFKDGIPPKYRTLIVMPAMLGSSKEIKSLLQQIELHYLRNQDPALGFALVTDFNDAPQQRLAEDDILLDEGIAGITALNKRYNRKFFLFHRQRLWNPAEGVWMGWERKRGKLHELNQLILGKDGTSFIVTEGDLDFLSGVRYVITLDADTILPKDGAARLVAVMAHPLNQAEFNERQEVVAGYTILQPRTVINPASANRSRFTRLFTGTVGLDLYTLAVSDVYQDLFGEGIYVGKGIYDVKAFERSLAGRAPENALLSHDLFEGIQGRAGLVTDIMLVEDFPLNYLVHARRQTRWVRGDWQLLPWLLGLPPFSGGKKSKKTGGPGFSPGYLSVIDRWKICDNLRRSLAEPALFLYLVAAWFWLPGPGALWTLAGGLSLGAPMLTTLLETIRVFITRARLAVEMGSLAGQGEPEAVDMQNLGDAIARWLLSLVFLPYMSLLHMRAILVTLWRVFISQRRLLRWTTSAQSAERIGEELEARLTWEQMAGALALSAGLGILIAFTNLSLLPPAAPLLAAWLASPLIAQWISRPLGERLQPLDKSQEMKLRRLARLTWLFFERFVGPEDHWLPPDHYQETPLGVVAHRTSPTNIGLLLVSTLAAYDLGYVDLLNLGARLQSTLDGLDKLERYRGHFINWFDTRSLAPLPPRYVSTVDSGNLAACLISLAQGLKSMADQPLIRKEVLQAVQDGLALILELSADFEVNRELFHNVHNLRETLESHIRQLQEGEEHLETWPLLLGRLIGPGWEDIDRALIDLVEAGTGFLGADDLGKLRLYTRALRDQLKGLKRENELLASWLEMLAQPPAYFGQAASASTVYTELKEILKPGIKLGEVDAATRTAQAVILDMKASLEAGPARAIEGTADQDPEPSGAGGRRAAIEWCKRMDGCLEQSRLAVKTLLIGFEEASRRAEATLREIDFSFLFDERRQVFHIGYNVNSNKLDGNYYDLLASEARLTSLVAIAKGDVPQSHWLHMSRPLTRVGDLRVLLSWSATMFEYLMPMLLACSYEGTLLQQSAEGAVKRQIQYGGEKGVPWGISESGYYRFDANQFYQYRAFGVPGLGYKRGMGEDLVVTPYASLLALPLEPRAVVRNMELLERLGLMGSYGFYEAVDFSPRRVSLGVPFHIVRSFMAHHQGMIFLSLANYFTGQAAMRRFHADPRVQAVDLLLQEQISMDVPLERPMTDDVRPVRQVDASRVGNPWRVRLQAPQPRVHFLSNGHYGVMMTSAGGGYSRWQEVDLTRWREDTTRSHWGTWVYIQDEESGDLWSVGYQPTNVPTGSRDVYFNAHVVELHRRDYDIGSTLEVTVPPGDDLEVRMVSLTNHSDYRRRLKLVSYGEVVLAPREADRRHPAFNKLFIESEYVEEVNALLFKRRLRSETDEPIFLAHVLVAGEGMMPTRAYESDRMRFLGRGKTSRAPRALLGYPTSRTDSSTGKGREAGANSEPTRPIAWLAHARQNQILEKLGVKIPTSDTIDRTPARAAGSAGRLGLSGTVGGTLDPIFSLGQEVYLEAHASCQVAFLTIAASRREEVLALARRYQSWQVIRRSFERARLAAEVELRQLSLDTPKLQVIERLLSLMLYPDPALRASPERLAANVKGQSGLWPFAISGDYPLLLVCIGDASELPLLQEILQAHIYWRDRGLKIDLVILNEIGTDYGQELSRQILSLLQRTASEGWLNRRGGIFLLVKDQMKEDERILLETTARAILVGKNGPLEAQLEKMMQLPPRLPAFVPPMPENRAVDVSRPVERPADLLFDNGTGGFSPDGREYVIFLKGDEWTPAPWINVVANPDFGFLVSETGSGCTWSENSGENRLTPWNNDPVCDQPGEAVYLRDEETGAIWSPTPLPMREAEPYLVRHGTGYSSFEHNSHGLNQKLTLFASMEDPVKVARLRLENTLERTRRVTVTYYVEWVLGVHRDITKLYIVPEYDGESQALLARNAYNNEFAGRVAFVAASKKLHGLTADRSEFIGRLGGLARPAALTRIGLGSVVEAGRDPCAALQLHVDLPPGGVEEVFFLLGEGEDRGEAIRLAKQYQQDGEVQKAWDGVLRGWEELFAKVQVRTPDPALDLLLNRWLLYQTLSCRVWGRSALYQSSGAYGFRDQLQDVMALVYAAPERVRAQILLAARRQFEAGDVLHWWHPPSGRGVRTRFSDDLLWLPYVTAEYIQASGDEGILDEKIPFIKADLLEPGEEERYNLFPDTTEPTTLYEHCLRALKKGATRGPHGLPLMGSGDWNDGMNKVGVPALNEENREGRGESIWLGWFLVDTLQRFAGVCERKGDNGQADQLRQKAGQYRQAIEASAWDGEWYLRAFYDDGVPLGSASRKECQIDSIAQSWGVLSGAADPQRARRAMQSVIERLVDWDEQLILLFTPPFNRSARNPGYIKGYLPGVRENGGQYTHASIWTAWAMADLGDGDTAGRLFRLLNPISHAGSPQQVQKYRVEPYSIAADIYGEPPHKGRGGWTWYTGSAGWMYRLGVERLLGLKLEGARMRFDPCIPGAWEGYHVTFRHCGSVYEIQVDNPQGVNKGVKSVQIDGKVIDGDAVEFVGDGGEHSIRIILGLD